MADDINRKGNIMKQLDLGILEEATHLGGPAALSAVTHLEPAAGPQALVAPAKYTGRSGATYVYEDRYVDGSFRRTVLIDSRSSAGNRIEDGLNQAIKDGHPFLSRVPHIEVRYETPDRSEKIFRDSELPHRFSDAHVRLGTVDGKPTTQDPRYRDARNATTVNAWALFELSPISIVLGVWDSTRKSNQVRFPAAVVGEIIGVISDVNGEFASATHRSGARVDPVGASVQLDASVASELAKGQSDELSPKLLAKIERQRGTVSGSNLGLGAIPPGTGDDALDGIATADIIRSYTVSFSTLRRLHFGKGADGDASIRALLAALALDGIVRNDAELYVRANCHLVEKAPTVVRLARRGGKSDDLEPLSVESADALLQSAYDEAEKRAGVDWHGQVFAVTGNPAVVEGAASDEDSEAAAQ